MTKALASTAPFCLLALIGLAAMLPGSAVTHAQSARPQDYLNRAADGVLALKSGEFALKREGTPAFLDEKAGLTFTTADCTYSAPDRVSCNVKVALKNGSIVQITRVWVPEGVFQSNPLSKQWAKVPPDTNFNGAVLFARTGIPDVLRSSVQKAQLVSQAEKLGSRDTVHVKGEVIGAKLNPLMGATLKADVLYPVDMWMEDRTSNIAQIHVAEPDGNGWMIAMFAANEPVTIATPQVPAPAAPAAPPRQ